MTNRLVPYYASYDHVETFAQAAAEGARQTGASAVIKRVTEYIVERVGHKLNQPSSVAIVAEPPDYDAIVIGKPACIGNTAAPMKNLLDQCGGLRFEDKLVGNEGNVFPPTGSQHSGQENTLAATHTMLLHLGMVVVGSPYRFKGQLRMDAINGATPYGASTLADDRHGGDHQPSDNELNGARFQGWHVARVASALAAAPIGVPQ
ncbi:NAD(P)H quinone oxidoreductase [Stutzerimonas stutzeri]|uniref:NAD(P)H quinone oxidoreductase n=1 Tax=Stutzerimonas stutzeri TaxID=316 RepID=W8RA13_STUST|nr:NAD(P)H:quinone oxidoreductase [Stutzerimonas stutzeri]AHL76478.1 NAD(P)H quinone oxidoreductase [Stutzerimonas stutzeri]MCQ4329713.1 NAD(P)H:quinone oxidoreductase [Stutzerimonas stutzeri]